MKRTKVLILKFNNSITHEEIPLFRGAINALMQPADILFHNHEEDGKYSYKYPLIQYKRINGKAAIVCVGEGTNAIGKLFFENQFDVQLGDRKASLEVESVNASQSIIQIWQDAFTYRIHRWLPLNKENYKEYCEMEGIAERCTFLEKKLVGNILSLGKRLDVFFENRVACTITELDGPYGVWLKDVKLMGFDATFKTNVSLPDFVGLGKSVSLGMGTVTRKHVKTNEIENN